MIFISWNYNVIINDKISLLSIFRYFIRTNILSYCVISVLYILSKANISLTSHFLNITRLGLAWLSVSWQRHLFLHKCFLFMYIFPSHLIILFTYTYMTWFYVDFDIIIKSSHSLYSYQLTNSKKRVDRNFIKT